MDLLFIGLIFVGAALTLKVITEGKAQVDELVKTLKTYQVATQQDNKKIELQEAENRKVKALAEKLRLDLDALKSRRRKMHHQTSQLEAELGKTRKASNIF